MNKIEQWLNAIINEDGHRMSAGSLRTIEMLRTEFKRLQLLQQTPCTTPVCRHNWVSSVTYKGAKVCIKCHAYQ